MKVLVVGAGVIGVTSAWYLSRAGCEVAVIDRHPRPAGDASYANGGQISASHAEPWANPGAPLQILRWLGRADAPLRFRPTADPAQWLWGARFLFECLPYRTRANTRGILALALRSVDELKRLRADTGIEYEGLARGILSFYTDGRAFDRAAAAAEELAALGCVREAKSAAQCVAVEPALADCAPRLAGGVYAPHDESGDARLFTERLAALCAQRGVVFRYACEVERIVVEAGRVAGMAVRDAARGSRVQTADAYVAASGVQGLALLRAAGIRLPVYPVKGYSVTLPVGASAAAPTVSLTDEARKLVYSRLGARLRVAGTAELAGYDARVDRARCDAIVARIRELFPRLEADAGGGQPPEYWAGLRPATPGNVPVIGGSRYPNLYLNTGHGTLGWTLACGSGRAIADIVAGRRPDIDFPFSGAGKPAL
jgi:D-amino-acid dehydrogenase